MKFRYMKLGDNMSARERSMNTSGSGNNYIQDLNFPGQELVLGIDPGTKGVGITIGLAKKPIAICVLQVDRGTTLLENSPEVFTREFNLFLSDFIKYNNVVDVQIESQFLNPKWKQSYRAITSFADSIKGTCKANGVRVFTVAPQSWKGIYLEKYPMRSTLNMSKSNKEHIISWTRQICPALYAFNATDAMDSFGILFYYYKTNYRGEGTNHIIQVRNDMPRDYRSQITMLFGKLDRDKTVESVLKSAEAVRQTSNVERGVHMFKVSDNFTLEDNIRSLITDNNDIYIAFFKPYLNSMAEMFRSRDKIGEINQETSMYVLGFRRIGK